MIASIVSLLPYLVAAVAGWAVRHYGLVGSTPAPSGTSPAQPTDQHVSLLQALTGQSAEDALKVLETAAQAAIQAVLRQAAQGKSGPPAAAPGDPK